jgi:hypothetical protein
MTLSKLDPQLRGTRAEVALREPPVASLEATSNKYILQGRSLRHATSSTMIVNVAVHWVGEEVASWQVKSTLAGQCSNSFPFVFSHPSRVQTPYTIIFFTGGSQYAPNIVLRLSKNAVRQVSTRTTRPTRNNCLVATLSQHEPCTTLLACSRELANCKFPLCIMLAFARRLC